MTTVAAMLLFLLAHPSQRIETQTLDRTKVTRVETAMNHLTVIELTEPVLMAAAGSPRFRIERRGNKVFLQPLEESASTNLFVWTSSGRWNYELVPAASPTTMHFAMDQQDAPPRQSLNIAPTAGPSPHLNVSSSFAEEMLLLAKPVRNLSAQFGVDVQASITDVYRKDNQLFVRFVIDNRTLEPYMTSVPEVFGLDAPSSHFPVDDALRYSQVGSDMNERIHSRSEDWTRVPAVEYEAAKSVPPGQLSSGIWILELPLLDSAPAVLQFTFPRDGREPMTLTLVL